MERAGAARGVAPTFTGAGGAGRGTVSGSSAQAVRSLCSVCHRLLMNRADAMHKHSLLYTLAFRRQFLHRLWSVVTSSQQASLMGCHPTPLLAVLSRGLKMTQEERQTVAPSLAVFSSLFGYLLVTINDTEFYSSGPEGGQARGQQGAASAWMPFSLAATSARISTISCATRCATDVAATRRGCVTSTRRHPHRSTRI